MNQKKLNLAVKTALIEMLREKETIDRIGDLIYVVVRRAIDEALTADVNFVDGKSEPGRQVEKTEQVNIILWLAKYLPDLEARLLGYQADSAEARNKSVETRNLVLQLFNQLPPLAGEMIDATPQGPRLGGTGEKPALMDQTEISASGG